MANEKRLIDANVLEYHKFCYMSANDTYRLGWNDAISAVMENAPTVDAVEVVHGKWMFIDLDGYWYNECSVCGGRTENNTGYPPDFNYCPNCGAKMDCDGNG